jgi:hypothetical protein
MDAADEVPEVLAVDATEVPAAQGDAAKKRKSVSHSERVEATMAHNKVPDDHMVVPALYKPRDDGDFDRHEYTVGTQTAKDWRDVEKATLLGAVSFGWHPPTPRDSVCTSVLSSSCP